MPYLMGPKSAAITPNKVSARKSRGTECSKNPTAAMPAMGTSASLSLRATIALSYLSASSPPKAEKTRKGATSRPPASVTRAPLCPVAVW